MERELNIKEAPCLPKMPEDMSANWQNGQGLTKQEAKDATKALNGLLHGKPGYSYWKSIETTRLNLHPSFHALRGSSTRIIT